MIPQDVTLSNQPQRSELQFFQQFDLWDTLFLTAVFLLIFTLSTSIVAVTGFLMGIPMSPWHLPIALFLSAGVMCALKLADPQKSWYSLGVSLGLGVAILGLLCFIYAHVLLYTDCDTTSYHGPAIFGILDGWNPLTQPFPFGNRQVGYTNNFWIELYPKAAYYLSATLAAFWGGKIAPARAYQAIVPVAALLMMIRLFCSQGTLKKRISKALVCLFAVLNPVVVYQFTGLLLDGFLGSLLTCVLVILLAIDLDKADIQNPFIGAALVSCIAIIGNVKFNGLFIAFVFCAFYLVKWIWDAFHQGRLQKALAFVLWGCIGLETTLFVGLSPYLRSFRLGIPLFYPVIGGGFSVHGTPHAYSGLIPPLKLIYALFTATGVRYLPKLPWSLQYLPYEAHNIYHDTIHGGFGPFFMLLLLATIGILVFLFLKRHESTSESRGILFSMLVIFATAFIFPESWWARYYPCLWLLPILASILLISVSRAETIYRIACQGMLLLLAINISFMAYGFFEFTSASERELASLISYHPPGARCEVSTDLPCFQYGVRHFLEQMGLKVTFVDHIENYDFSKRLFTLRFLD